MAKPIPWWVFVLGGVAVVAFLKRKTISDIGGSMLDAANAAVFSYALPSEARPYADVIKRVASEAGVDPFVLAALGQQESRWGQALSPVGPGGTGDAGHGHGIMQIDDRTWGAWLNANDWTDPYTNVSKGADILNSNISYFTGKGLTGDALMSAALAAYNGGPGRVWQAIQAGQPVDSVTTGWNGSTGYSSSVLARVANYMGTAQSQTVPAAPSGTAVALVGQQVTPTLQPEQPDQSQPAQPDLTDFFNTFLG